MDFFEHPLRLLHMLWLAPLFGVLVYWATTRRNGVLKALFGPDATPAGVTTLSLGRRYIRLWLLFAALLLLCVAYARPRWGWRILPFSGRGRDLMVLIDVSKSMLSEDVKPSRLKHAKQFVRELIESTPGNRYGLVDFAGSAFLECPMTVDKTSLFQALDELNVNSIPVGGTNIESALKEAMRAFKAAEGGYRAIILITDGDELYGDSSQVVQDLKKLKIPLFVVGVGDPDGDGLIKITGPNGKTKLMRDSMGKLVKSRLNEKGLKRLAERTGGIYVRSTETNLGLAPIRERIKKLVPKEYSKGNCKRPIERFHYPLLAAVILLLIRLSIGERERKGARLAALLCLSASLFSAFPADAAGSKVSSASVPSKAGLATAGAAKRTTGAEGGESSSGRRETPVSLYNHALELHKKRKFDEAAELYRRAVNMDKVSEEVRSKAFQNLGVISHTRGEALMSKDPDAALKIFDKAEEMYKESMRSDVRRKRVVLNQQRLLDDRRLAKLIKKRREEMRRKREQARKKAQKALNQQKRENQAKKNDEDKRRKDEKERRSRRQSKCDKRTKSENDKSNGKNKNGDRGKSQKSAGGKSRKNEERRDRSGKKDYSGKSGSKREERRERKASKSAMDAERKETRERIKQAEKAAEDYKKAARNAASKKDEKLADEAERELRKAREEHDKGEGGESEKHLRRALEKLSEAGGKRKDEGEKSERKPHAGNKKDSKKGRGGNKRRPAGLQQGKPNPRKQRDASGAKGEEKNIDPAQAAALLEMMANGEKTLRKALKEREKRAAGVSKVLKDW